MIHLGDITKIHGAPFVDCITFGSPCQDLSIAGKRAGLAGERSGLFIEAVRIIKEMREQSGRVYPAFAVWENVPGAFSSNKGEDFRAVLEELARIKEPEVSIPRPENGKWAKAGFIAGNGWSIAWRTFDAQFWGVPQRRRRIAVVLDLGGQRAGEILFERTGVSGHLEPSIPPWQGIARNPAHGVAGHDRVVEGAGSYTLKIRSGCEGGGKGALVQTEKSATLSTLQDQTLFVAAYPNIARSLTARHDGSPCVDRGPNVVCCAADIYNGNVTGNVAESLTTATGQGASNTGPSVMCFGVDGYSGCETGNKSITIRAGKSDQDHVGCVSVSHRMRGFWDYVRDDAASSAKARDYKDATDIVSVMQKFCWIVRRFTPTECERLQGFPDGWTDIGEWVDSKGKRHKPADSPRYKALGNSIALPQWWWLTCKMARYLPKRATLGSLFDGIGGFPLVWETLHGKGTAVWASEIEEFAIAVTKARFS